ncbi:hypothetical protein A2Y99_04785 [Candidatus Gottesmanbacteria bacterium RBG_13_37_7]|uniref:50S ribosomal protein L22 n=1 Tax=Candidatus Gottesmanbacteria bacterium RBG_13_37_7 TaxID=1798369 RepID=A0A1F5YJ85_9BACT|nr:MAG: hypothetical protein A2Y99_04785 [Candidatus Gottesmanbacteria bacterium RBG_13_37_7]
MNAIANIKYLRISAKKAKEIGRQIVGLNPKDAVDRLTVYGTKPARLMVKAVNSALSNAVKNQKQAETLLRIKSVEVNKGPVFKRWQAVSRGSAHEIKKRTSHFKIVLEEIPVTKENNLKRNKGIALKEKNNKNINKIKKENISGA